MQKFRHPSSPAFGANSQCLAGYRALQRQATRTHAWDPLSDQKSNSPGVLADPESPEASRPPLIFVDDKVSRDSTEEVTNLIRSVSIAVFLRLRLELLGLQGVEYGDPKTIQRVFGKSREEIEPQHQLIKLLSGIILPQLPALELPTLDTEIKATPQKV